MENKGENLWNDCDYYCGCGFSSCFSHKVDYLDAAVDYCHCSRFMDFFQKAGWTVGWSEYED